MNNSLSGKVAIITGANQGLGLEIASQYLAEGASLVLCARNAPLLQNAQQQLLAQMSPSQFIEVVAADVSNPTDVEKVVAKALERGGRIDILVNNAGILGPMGNTEEVDWQAWVNVLQVNVQGSVLMARAVLPIMKQQHKGKIIQLSGGGATSPMPQISAYAASKAAIVRFAETLAQEVQAFGIDVNAIAPGALNTRMLEEVLDAGPDKVGKTYFDRSIKQKETGGASIEKAAQLAVFLASAASDGITGRLISAVWDNWQQWPDYRDELAASDAYTLRRITGRDRGFAWGDN